MKEKITFREAVGRGLCWAVPSFEEEYNLYSSEDSYIGHTDKKDGYYKFIPIDDTIRKKEQKFISYTLNSLNNCLYVPETHYVYVVFVDKALKYIGKGMGTRFAHSVSGVSHVYELNKAYFENSIIEVFLYAEGMKEKHALNLESGLISRYGCPSQRNLYNTKGVTKDNIRDFDCSEEDFYYSLIRKECLIGVKVGYDEEYEFLRDYEDCFKFEPVRHRYHEGKK